MDGTKRRAGRRWPGQTQTESPTYSLARPTPRGTAESMSSGRSSGSPSIFSDRLPGKEPSGMVWRSRQAYSSGGCAGMVDSALARRRHRTSRLARSRKRRGHPEVQGRESKGKRGALQVVQGLFAFHAAPGLVSSLLDYVQIREKSVFHPGIRGSAAKARGFCADIGGRRPW